MKSVFEENVEEKIRSDIDMLHPDRVRMIHTKEKEITERVWMKLAIVERELGNVEEERSLLFRGLKQFPSFFKLWLMLGQLEERFSHLEQAKKAYDFGLKHCPNCIPLWLSLANVEEKVNGLNKARVILTMAREKNPQAEELWLAAVRTELRHGNKREAEHLRQECLNSGSLCAADIDMLLFENKDPERTRMVLAKARESGGTERVWLKSATVERELGNVKEERSLLAEGLKQFPSFFKLWLMLGQLEERFCHTEQAKKAYDSGLKHCPNCIPLWLSLANLEEKVNGLNKARVILTMAREKNPQADELWLAAVRTELRHGNKREAEHLRQECLNSGSLCAADIDMLKVENKDLERAMMIQEERRLLTGDQLPPALLGIQKDDSVSALPVDEFNKIADGFACVLPEYKIKTCYKSSSGEEESSSEDDRVFEDDFSEEEFVSEEDDQMDIDYIGMMKFPSRSTARSKLPKDFCKRLAKNVMEYIKKEDAEKCLSQERFSFVLDTNPLPDSFYMSDSNGFLILFWYTNGPPDKYILDEVNRRRLKFVGGFIRNQKEHLLCWTYVSTDLISATRLLHGLDSEFVPLSAMFLCRNVRPEQYKENCKANEAKDAKEAKNDGHCCFGQSIVNGLMYAKLHGVPREKPEEKEFDCRVSKQFAGDEELYRIKDVFHYETLELALERVKSGYPVGAGLICFEGWNKHWKSDEGEIFIYNGPESGAKYCTDMHGVIILDFTVIHGIKVAICKSSNGEEFGNRGYIAVNLEIMLTLVGAAKKKGQPNWCRTKPQYLLQDFYSVDVEMGSQPLIKVDPDREKENMKFKVATDGFGGLLAPIYQNPSCVSIEKLSEHESEKTVVISEKQAFVDGIGNTGYVENPWGIVDDDDCCGCAKSLVSFGSAGDDTTLESLAFEDVIKAGASLYVGMQIQARKFYDRFQMGKVYYISRGSLKLANKQFKTVQNDYEMTINENSEARNDSFVRIYELGAYVNQKELIDVVIGVVQSVSPTMSIRRRNDNEMIPEKDTPFADETRKTVLWNKLATGIDQELLAKYPVTVINSLKVGDCQGVPLSAITRSNVMINPDSPDATNLKYWYDSEGKETFLSAIGSGMSSSVNYGSRSMYSDMVVCLSHFTSNLSLGEEKTVFFSTRAYTGFIKPDQTMWYRACKTWNKKETEAMDSV